MSEPEPSDYNNMRDCAAAGCERHCRDGGDAYLERVSPKGPGKPFVGLCQDHYPLLRVILKREAGELLDGR